MMKNYAYRLNDKQLIELAHVMSISEIRNTFADSTPCERAIYARIANYGFRKPRQLKNTLIGVMSSVLTECGEDFSSTLEGAVEALRVEFVTDIRNQQTKWKERQNALYDTTALCEGAL
jgi:hypothetical protein